MFSLSDATVLGVFGPKLSGGNPMRKSTNVCFSLSNAAFVSSIALEMSRAFLPNRWRHLYNVVQLSERERDLYFKIEMNDNTIHLSQAIFFIWEKDRALTHAVYDAYK